MTIKHRIPCYDSEIVVRSTVDNVPAFKVSIQSTKNPLGSGTTLGSYATEDQAVKMSERFCTFYSKARENGYYLRSDTFVKSDVEEIPVAFVLDGTKNNDQIEMLIKH